VSDDEMTVHEKLKKRKKAASFWQCAKFRSNKGEAHCYYNQKTYNTDGNKFMSSKPEKYQRKDEHGFL